MQDQRSNPGLTMMLHTYNPPPMSLPNINFQPPYGFRNIAQRGIIGQGHYGKVKSRSHHDVLHLHTLANVPTKYQLPTPYDFRDVPGTRFYTPRSIQKGQRSNQGQVMMLHIYNP